MGIHKLLFVYGHISQQTVEKHLLLLKEDSSPGVIGIPTKVFKFCANELKEPFAALFNQINIESIIPDEFKISIITPIYKKKSINKKFKIL